MGEKMESNTKNNHKSSNTSLNNIPSQSISIVKNTFYMLKYRMYYPKHNV